jgi:hypothetical protein
MSTHSAECIRTLASDRSEASIRLDMIRKTSLLRKIEPVMRRSSFTNKDAAHPDHLAMPEHSLSRR